MAVERFLQVFAFQQLTSKHKNTILDKLLQKKDYVGSPFCFVRLSCWFVDKQLQYHL